MENGSTPMQMKLLMTSTAFVLAMATAPAVMAQNSTGMGNTGAPGSASSDMVQTNPPKYQNGMGSTAAPTTVDRSAAAGSNMAGSNLGMNDQERATASTAAIGQPMTASGAASAQSNSMTGSVPGTLGDPTTPNMAGSSLGASEQERATSSAAATGQPLAAGSAASKQSFDPNASVIGKGPPGPGVAMPSAMLVPPHAS